MRLENRRRGIGAVEAFQSGERQNGRVHRAFIDFAQSRFDIAAQGDDVEIGAQPFHLRGATQRRGAELCAFRQCRKICRLAADEGVAHILARQTGRHDQSVGQ